MVQRRATTSKEPRGDEPPMEEVGGVARELKEELHGARTAQPAPQEVPSKSQSERVAEAFEELTKKQSFKQSSESMARELRSFLMENCKIELSPDPAIFAEQIRDGVGFPKICTLVADMEYVFDSISRGSLTDSMRKRLNQML